MGEIVRFSMVGILATAIQYGIYLLFLRWAEPRISNTIGYAVSFVFNYFASTYFTFRVKSTARRGAALPFHILSTTYCKQERSPFSYGWVCKKSMQ